MKSEEIKKLLPTEHFLPRCFAIDLSNCEMLEFEKSTYSLTNEDAQKIEEFKLKYPNFLWAAPYEGDVVWVFSSNNQVPVSNAFRYHNGGGARVGNLLVSLDLD